MGLVAGTEAGSTTMSSVETVCPVVPKLTVKLTDACWTTCLSILSEICPQTCSMQHYVRGRIFAPILFHEFCRFHWVPRVHMPTRFVSQSPNIATGLFNIQTSSCQELRVPIQTLRWRRHLTKKASCCIRISFIYVYTCDRNWEFICVIFLLVHNMFRPLRAILRCNTITLHIYLEKAIYITVYMYYNIYVIYISRKLSILQYICSYYYYYYSIYVL
jgi:hypothetical protein